MVTNTRIHKVDRLCYRGLNKYCFFFEDLNIYIPGSADRTPVDLAEFRKLQHSKGKNTIFNEHPDTSELE